MSFGRLYRVDTLTLERIPGRDARVDGHTFGWSFSNDRSKIALGSQIVPELRFIDLERMRIMGGDDVRLKRRGIVAATAWPASRRVLAVVQTPACCIGEASAFVVDPVTRRILRRYELRGSLQAFRRFRGGLVLLLSPPRSVGGSRLAVLDRHGKLRSVALARIRSGQEPIQPGRQPGDEHRPGLAVDVRGRRAFIIGSGAPVAEVGLDTLRVRYHPLRHPASVLATRPAWLEPTTRADVPPIGPVRSARWVGGRIAVAGSDSYYERIGTTREYRTRPAGLTLIDLGRGRVRTLDPLAERFVVVAGTIIPVSRQLGLAGYSLDGSRRFRLFRGSRVAVALTLGARVFVTVDASWPRAHVVDVRSARVLGEQSLPKAQLLTPSLDPHWP